MNNMASLDLEIQTVKPEDDKSCHNCHLYLTCMYFPFNNKLHFILDTEIAEFNKNFKKLFKTIAEVCRFYERRK
jgi:hypothetical protein